MQCQSSINQSSSLLANKLPLVFLLIHARIRWPFLPSLLTPGREICRIVERQNLAIMLESELRAQLSVLRFLVHILILAGTFTVVLNVTIGLGCQAQ